MPLCFMSSATNPRRRRPCRSRRGTRAKACERRCRGPTGRAAPCTQSWRATTRPSPSSRPRAPTGTLLDVLARLGGLRALLARTLAAPPPETAPPPTPAASAGIACSASSLDGTRFLALCASSKRRLFPRRRRAPSHLTICSRRVTCLAPSLPPVETAAYARATPLLMCACRCVEPLGAQRQLGDVVDFDGVTRANVAEVALGVDGEVGGDGDPLAAHGGRGQVLLELGPDHPARPVRPRRLAPRSTVDGALLLGLGLVHVAQLLAGRSWQPPCRSRRSELDERRVVGLVRDRRQLWMERRRRLGVSVRFERGGMVRPRTVRLARGSSSLEPRRARRATPDAERSARRGSPSGGNATVASSPRGGGMDAPCGHANVARPSWG